MWGRGPALYKHNYSKKERNNACKIKFIHKILDKNKFFKTEDNVPVVIIRKKYGKFFFGILKVTEERSRILSWIRIQIH
jgi:hypothetical protein